MQQERENTSLEDFWQDTPSNTFSRRQFNRRVFGLALGTAVSGTLAEVVLSYLIKPEPVYLSVDWAEINSLFAPELARELRDQIILRDPETGQRMAGVMLNRRKLLEEKTLIVAGSGYMSDLGDTAYLIKAGFLAKRTNHPVWAPDYYGRGDSDDLTAEQIERMEAGEGMIPVAEAWARTLSDVYVPEKNTAGFEQKRKVGVDGIWVAGNSMGASVGSALVSTAKETGNIEIKRAVLVEPVGVTEFPWERLAYKFINAEKPGDNVPNKLTEIFLRVVRRKVRIKDDPGFHYAAALGQEFVPDALTKGLTSNDKLRVVLAWGTESPLCPDEIMISLAEKLGVLFPGRVKDRPFEGMGHGIFGPENSMSAFFQRRFLVDWPTEQIPILQNKVFPPDGWPNFAHMQLVD